MNLHLHVCGENKIEKQNNVFVDENTSFVYNTRVGKQLNFFSEHFEVTCCEHTA